MKATPLSLCCLVCWLQAMPQSVERLTAGRQSSLRGLSVVDDRVAWASGSQGTVGRSTDGGLHWTWMTVPGFEGSDFRDIEAWNEHSAVIMAVGRPAWILYTEDGGAHWSVAFSDTTTGVFLDAMHFLPDGSGVCVGDPIDGRLYELRTTDAGRSWQRIPATHSPILSDGEAFFAASGTNAALLPNGQRLALSGGRRSRLLAGHQLHDLPLQQGSNSTGGNSLAMEASGQQLIAVGGDFSRDRDTSGTCALSTDGGMTWQVPLKGLNGYRSCVSFIDSRQVVACGTSGVDASSDGGRQWKSVSQEGFHVCSKAKHGQLVLLAGTGGRIARYKP